MNIKDAIREIKPAGLLRKYLLAYSKIDWIMNPDPDKSYNRIYHFDKKWIPGGYFFEINDSGGDHYYLLFSSDGYIIKGFAHESDLSPYNFDEDEPIPDAIAKHDFYKGAPPALLKLLDDPALEKELVTFFIWQPFGDAEWHFAESEIPNDWDDGTETFLHYIPDLANYKKWFEEDYYESPLDAAVLKQIFDEVPITDDIIKSLNPEGNPKEILRKLREIF